MSKQVYYGPVFDGETVWEKATVVIENGVIAEGTSLGEGEGTGNQLLMPGLWDAHTHINNTMQMKALVDCGVLGTCDVAISKILKDEAKDLQVITSYNMALGDVLDSRKYVEEQIKNGADYIKVILEEPARMASRTMPLEVLKDIVVCAHEYKLKVAVHAVSVKMVDMAVNANVDILIHVPMREVFPETLANKIAHKRICVVPTLAMMETFANLEAFGYKKADYDNARNAVRLLCSKGVMILAGTDANESPFAPKVEHGKSLHRELELLVDAGLTEIEALKAATQNVVDGFGIESSNAFEIGAKDRTILVKGRPDQNILDIYCVAPKF